jgi:hypothetical protein
MTILATTLLLVSVAISADVEMPKDFLQVKSEAWNQWLNEDANTHWTEIPLKDVLNGVFGTAELSIDKEEKLNTPITFDSTKLSRRVALWRLSRKYDFKVRWDQKREPVEFLGLFETKEMNRSIGGIGVTVMTSVMRADYKIYLELKRDGKIKHEKRVENTIYYSYDLERDLRFENGTAAHVTAVQRYKTTAPPEKKTSDPKSN